MNIKLSENLKKLRLARQLTQDDLAQFLGVTYQAVSKWERNEGYPDITMLPIIANYFEVTVDMLLGNDLISKEERIAQYRDAYWKLNGEEAAALAKQAYAEYPYEWGIIEIYILSLTRGFSQMPDDETAVELRRLCEFTMEKCTNAIIRKRAVYTMIYIEDDEHVERWFAEAPDNPDYLETERREERYLDHQQWELFYPQKQNNMMDLLNNLLGKMGCYHEACDPEWRIASRQRRLDLLDAMFKGTDRVLLSPRYCNCLIELAMSLADAGRIEETIAALTEAIDRYEEHCQLGENLSADEQGKVHLSDPMWNCLSQPAFPRKLNLSFLETLAEKSEYTRNETFQKLLERGRALN